MTDNTTTSFNGMNYCYCKSCIISKAKKLENENLFSDAFQVLHDAELYYSQITKELEEEKRKLCSRLDGNDRIHFETIQSSRKKSSSTSNMSYHPPLNVACGKQKVYHRIPTSNINDEFSCPVAVFENKLDPQQKPMYPKNLVYKDGKDVQLEEIRAAIYWERMKMQDTQISNQLKPEKNTLHTSESRTSLYKIASSTKENISSPYNKEIKKPLQVTFDKNLTDSSKQSGTANKLLTAVNQIKPEVDTLITNDSATPLHSSISLNMEKISTLGIEIKNSLLAKSNESPTDSIQQFGTSAVTNNASNQTIPEENTFHISLHRKIKIGQDSLTNNKQRNENSENPTTTNQKIVRSQNCSFAADKQIFIEEQKQSHIPVNVDTSVESKQNKLENAVTLKADPKFTDATFICKPIQETSCTLQKTYLIEGKQKATCSQTENLNKEVLKTPKQSKEQRTSKVQPVKNEDKENVLPINMISPPWDEDEEDNTCNTKAFAVILPSSTPNKRRSQFYGNGLFTEPKCSIATRPSIASTTTINLSMIPETSRERSSSSSATGSVASVVNSKNFVQDKPTLSAIAETEEKSNSLPANCDISDPFNPELLDNLLGRLQFPCEHHQNGYHLSKSDIPTIKLSNSCKLGSKKYTIAAEIGKGSYARILKAYLTNQPTTQVALKIQKPACVWEYYICKEIINRLNSKEKCQYFLHYSDIFVFQSCSILLSEWGPYGSLLHFRNALKITNSGSDKYPMAVGVHLIIQIVSAIDYLHSCKIIHGDIKPDNFIISSVSNDGKPSIKLIDFGRSIDMTLFPKNTVFHKVVTTEDFTCNEMRDGRAWTYQTDLFGMAGTIYVLLTGEYMRTIKKNNGVWVLKKPLARYMYRDQWDPIFMVLLNVPSCNELPDLSLLKTQLETFYNSFNSFEKKQQEKWRAHQTGRKTVDTNDDELNLRFFVSAKKSKNLLSE